MELELVTEIPRLEQLAGGWEELADTVDQPRATGGIVAAWAHHMMEEGSELRIWFATQGDEVVGVLPFVSEAAPGHRERLLPPATTMMFGSIPIARPDREKEVVAAIVDAFGGSVSRADLVSVYWVPPGSPWIEALDRLLSGPDWAALDSLTYCCGYVDLADGIEAWFGRRQKEFRRVVSRRGRRQEEEGFHLHSTFEPSEIIERLPAVQTLYRARQGTRGGTGYRFDGGMIAALSEAITGSKPGRFGLVTIERGDTLIAMQLCIHTSRRTSAWLTGFDMAWLQFGPGIAVMLGAIAASAAGGCTMFEFGEGDEGYKGDLVDGRLSLQTHTWCRPRIARLLQTSSEEDSVSVARFSGDVEDQ
jgi:CelD/BcsL family acetyltransferase involved in cellulose biosynthesis